MIRGLIQAAHVARSSSPNATDDYVFQMVVAALKMMEETHDVLDFKIATAAIKEMRYAFRVFAPYRTQRKVSIWGSARTDPSEPIYGLARDLGRAMARRGWMVITGAGQGIMAAGHEGAGRDQSFGLKIMLPMEDEPNRFIEEDPKLIHFKYFFVRKLFFVRESSAMALFPGGMGTLDEGFELFTLLQTGRSPVMPLVLMDTPGGTYWSRLVEWLRAEVLSRGMIAAEDLHLFKLVRSVDEAVKEITSFYGNFHSMRYVGQRLILRYLRPLPDETVRTLPSRFPQLFRDGPPEQLGPLAEEKDEPELSGLLRLAFAYEGGMGPVRVLVDEINRC
ncbi:MAG: TIGR00730 family Rossman fold protein [Nitrospirae bacterium]|nr:TIGR00730 family Rossman fold protein [Nitrospirota bacterium]